ncbi:oxygenase MpaB family protein [Albimonas pacifica]|uniref:ER-bound oxygenase mpaB/mpaB'/Rubber oxygenase catalytic domain-containing protein n=1 Tax=Albimonas pacifica TaxID=1114924 RepID=A0A1I3DZR8_9RHOB|nr:oxygenase MpaB family protein [Albimonas pacifica]SFH92232.1 hypothetical protein SAMN05216258_103105 [Albimonas pacifica]
MIPQDAPAAPPAVEPEVEAAVRRLATLEFSWDIEKALEFALFRTYAVPEISGLLARTGEFARRPRKRYDDTALIIAEIGENGLDSARGAAAVARMNAMHGRYRIANAEMLYVLTTFVCEPIRWLERHGRRPMTEAERRAWFEHHRALGARMGIEDIPGSLEETLRWNAAYEAGRFRFAQTNREVADRTVDLLLGFYLPRPLIPLGRPVVRALMDPPLLAAMGFAPAPGWLQRLVAGGLALRARVLRRLGPRRTPRLLTRAKRPTYPEGYRIEELGTFR